MFTIVNVYGVIILVLDFKDDLEWLNEKTILLTITGSIAYGTNTANSDRDYRGVCIPPQDYFFGLKSFNEYNTTGGKNFKNTKDDIDIAITHISKFVAEAMKGIPNNIEILFTNPEHIISKNEFGDELISHRYEFLTKALKHKFSGYAISQKKKIVIKGNNGTGRQDLIQKYGYDTKFAMHSIRLLDSAKEILQTQDFSTFRPNRDELLAIRNGRYTEQQILKIIDDLDQELSELYISSKLPNTPNYKHINEWLTKLNRRALGI